MLSYSQISRWLEKPTDPITVEDWLANREIFGPSQDEALELAYLLETVREGKKGFFEVEKVLLVSPPTGGGEAWLYGEKIEKIKLPKSGTLQIKVNPSHRLKLKIAGKEWEGKGKERIIFDL